MSNLPQSLEEMLTIAQNEVSHVKTLIKGRKRQNYLKILDNYKGAITEKQMHIIRSGFEYIFMFNRIHSIDETTALKLLKIFEIPISHIVMYTNKNILINIAKQLGISHSNKRAQELVEAIRNAISPE